MQIRSAFSDGIEQRLVDKANHGCVINVGILFLFRFLFVTYLEILEVSEVIIA